MARLLLVQNLDYQYLSYMYLSAFCKKAGHDVDVLIGLKNLETVAREVIKQCPDVVGFYCSTGLHIWCLDVAKQIKRLNPNVLIYFGGPHPTFFPEVIREDGVDVICMGEGENPTQLLLSAIEKGTDYSQIGNLWIKKRDSNEIVKNPVKFFNKDLDTLPFPDRNLYRRYPWTYRTQKVFISTRGCPYQCTFCYNSTMKNMYKEVGGYYRRRSVENVINEVREVCKEGTRSVYMNDDTFTIERNWLRCFVDSYKREINLPFVCMVRADVVDEEIVSLLRQINCKRVFFGIETGNESMRKTILGKNITDKQIFKTAELLKKNGIRFRTFNMVGLPNETLDDAYSTVQMNIRIGTHYPYCSIFQPFPKTEMYNYCKDRGLLTEKYANLEDSSIFITSYLKSDVTNEMINIQRFFMFMVKFPRLKPFFKRLIRVKPNKLFDIIFLLGHFYVYTRSQFLTFCEVIPLGFRAARKLFHFKIF